MRVKGCIEFIKRKGGIELVIVSWARIQWAQTTPRTQSNRPVVFNVPFNKLAFQRKYTVIEKMKNPTLPSQKEEDELLEENHDSQIVQYGKIYDVSPLYSWSMEVLVVSLSYLSIIEYRHLEKVLNFLIEI